MTPPGTPMKASDLEPFRIALSRHLAINRTKRVLNGFLPFEKMWDIVRHIFSLLEKFRHRSK